MRLEDIERDPESEFFGKVAQKHAYDAVHALAIANRWKVDRDRSENISELLPSKKISLQITPLRGLKLEKRIFDKGSRDVFLDLLGKLGIWSLIQEGLVVISPV